MPSSAGVENKMLLLVLPHNKRQLYIKAQSLALVPAVSNIFKPLNLVFNSNPLRKVRGFEVSTQRTLSENVGNISATDLGFPRMSFVSRKHGDDEARLYISMYIS